MVSHIMAWNPCASSPNITMKACARVVVIEADCHVSPQRQLGGLMAIGPFLFLNYLIDYTCLYACKFFFLKTRGNKTKCIALTYWIECLVEKQSAVGSLVFATLTTDVKVSNSCLPTCTKCEQTTQQGISRIVLENIAVLYTLQILVLSFSHYGVKDILTHTDRQTNRTTTVCLCGSAHQSIIYNTIISSSHYSLSKGCNDK